MVRSGLVVKNEEGLYELTPTGRRSSIGIKNRQFIAAERAYSTLLLLIRGQDGAYLLARRLIHPLIGLVGLPHCSPVAGQKATETAQDFCVNELGVMTNFKISGSGFFSFYQGDTKETFTNFTLLAAEDATCVNPKSTSSQELYWQINQILNQVSFCLVLSC